MKKIINSVKHACIVVSSDQTSSELFESVLGFQSNRGRESHIFNVERNFEIHACADSPRPLGRIGWPGNDPPSFPPDFRTPRSIIGLPYNNDGQLLERIQSSKSALKLNSFIIPGSHIFDSSAVVIRDSDDHIWLKEKKITRYIPISNRDRASSFYTLFLGTPTFSSVKHRYPVSENFDIYLIDTRISGDFRNSSLFQQLSHFCVEVVNLKQTISTAFERSIQPFQMDSNGNRKDLTSPTDDLSFGYGSIYLYDPDGNLWEFQQS